MTHPPASPSTPKPPAGPVPGPRPAPTRPRVFLAPARYLAAFVWGVVALGEALVDRITGRHA